MRHHAAIFGSFLALFAWSGQAQTTYRQGDLVENFSLINRASGQPLQLSDFEGKIVFLEWFAWW